MGCGKKREASAPIRSLVKLAALDPEFAVEDLPSGELQPRFLYLQSRTCPWTEHSDGEIDGWMNGWRETKREEINNLWSIATHATETRLETKRMELMTTAVIKKNCRTIQDLVNMIKTQMGVLMPTHCTIKYFGFRDMRINGDNMIYFRFTHLLGRPRHAGTCICICVLKEVRLE